MNLSDLLAPRPMADVIAARARVTLGGREYLLPAKVISANERWKAQLDTVLVALLYALDDDTGMDSLLTALSFDPDPFLELLLSYDHEGLLPGREELRDTATEMELLIAVMECWRAADPKVEIATAAGMTGIRTGALPRLTSSLRPSTAGPSPTSGMN